MKKKAKGAWKKQAFSHAAARLSVWAHDIEEEKGCAG
jgi:hypothetical protein